MMDISAESGPMLWSLSWVDDSISHQPLQTKITSNFALLWLFYFLKGKFPKILTD